VTRDCLKQLDRFRGAETVVVEVGMLGSRGGDECPELPMVHLDCHGSVEIACPHPGPLGELAAQVIREVMEAAPLVAAESEPGPPEKRPRLALCLHKML
jgi:hypothetical protein